MRPLTLALLVLAAHQAARAEVHKCTDAAGHKHYQDRPCTADQQTTPFDAQGGNFTTIDSAASREQTQGALQTRQDIRQRYIPEPEPRGPAAVTPRPKVEPEPEPEPQLAYPDVLPYGIFIDRDRFHGKDPRQPDIRRPVDPRERYRPDTDRSPYTPGSSRGSPVPSTPSISQVAPRPPPPAATGTSPNDRDPDERREHRHY